MRLKYCCLLWLLLSPSLHAATVTIQGGQTNQVIDGFGINANYRSWNGTELQPVLDAFIDQAGMTLFRVTHDLSDWEVTNDNADPSLIDWTFYNPVYSSTEFTRLWDMFAYLNQRGITNGAFFNFMGWGPDWMMESDGRTLKGGMEEEWAEMITSALVYARSTRGLQFSLIAPNNEPDIYNEGIHMDATPYVNSLHQLALKLDANGMGDLRFVGPDRAGGGTGYMPEMLADPVIMAKLKHFGVHSYSGDGGGSGGVSSFIESSDYPDRTFWMTEFNVWCSTCDNGTRGTYDWAYTRGTADYMLNHLLNGASACFPWEGYDSYYEHHGAWGFWGLFAVDDEDAVVKTYTPRKNFYTVTQVSKWVRPGAQRINVSGAKTPFTPLLAFKHDGLGQITIVGINTSVSATTLNGTLAELATVPFLNLYYTSATTNLADGGSVVVNNGVFSTTIPADCVFTLTGSKPLPLLVTTTNLPSAKLGESHAFPLAASGGVSPYVWVMATNASTPAGLELSTNGILSGVPSAVGQYSFAVVVSDSVNMTVDQTMSLGISEPILILGAVPQSGDEIANLGFRLTMSADVPGMYLVQRTDNFTSWQDVQQINYTNGVVQVTDKSAATNQSLFYRAIRQ